MANDTTKFLTHVAVILDGNGRWAKERGLERVEGHIAGADNVVNLMSWMERYPEIKYVTLYAFSTENWKRSQEEVNALMELLCRFLDEKLPILKERRIRLLASGDLSGLPLVCQERLKHVKCETSVDYERTLILALNYGSRNELVHAMRKIGAKVRDGQLNIEDITERTIGEHLYLPEIPDPDLLIRTSGECRLSNFLLWQLSYSEFYFTDTYWPDFGIEDFDKAVQSYYHRERRYGGRKS